MDHSDEQPKQDVIDEFEDFDEDDFDYEFDDDFEGESEEEIRELEALHEGELVKPAQFNASPEINPELDASPEQGKFETQAKGGNKPGDE